MEGFSINTDCRFFKGDRPCKFHKEQGVHCSKCQYYEPVRCRILIIKLDAIGDVLRTTHILKPLKERYQGAQITWITRSESVPLFINNPLIDRVFDIEQAFFVLYTDKFDVVINLDASPLSSRLATVAKGVEKLGFVYHEKGYVYPINSEAVEWFLMGIFDGIKRENKKTYQQIVLEICRLPANPNNELIFNLTEEESEFGRRFALKNNLNDGNIRIGFNTGAGGRWQYKKWTVEGFISLSDSLRKEFPECKILLYGGENEKDRNDYLKKMVPGLIDTGSGNSIREFAALLNLCDILVTGDTLAMHIAVALKKRVVVLFGPTSHTEIELYGRGEKIVSPLECNCCYKNTCDIKPDCMEAITSDMVLEGIRRLSKLT